jgi:hypothetical protein
MEEIPTIRRHVGTWGKLQFAEANRGVSQDTTRSWRSGSKIALQQHWIQTVLPESERNIFQHAPSGRRQLKSEALDRSVQNKCFLSFLRLQLFQRPRFHSDRLHSTTVCKVHLLPKPLFTRSSSAQRLQSLSLCAEGLIDLALEFLFLLCETTELWLCHFDIAFLIHAITVIGSSGTNMNFADRVVHGTTTAFLNHGVSEIVEEVGEVETAGGAVASMNNRHLANPWWRKKSGARDPHI